MARERDAMECGKCGHQNLPEARFCANCGAALVVAPVGPVPTVAAPAAQPSAIVEYSGFWLRFVAFLLDSIILVAASFLVRLLFLFPSGNIAWPVFLGVFPSIFYWLYYWLFTGLRGQTPGKMVLGIKVVRANGEKVGLGWAALREIPGKIISLVGLFLGFIWIAWDKKKQGWHDKIADTIVIRAKPGP
jgi:uncharacterized RDD family membrane protein YckC